MKRILILLLTAAMLVLPASGAAGEKTGSVRLPIVMYHHLSPKPSLWGQYVLSTEEFAADMEYLYKNGYETVTAAQLVAWTKGEGELPEKPVMITFDDGYESTPVYAGPILEEYGFQAVIAVIGSCADLFTEKEDHMLDYSYLSWSALRELSHGNTFEIQCHTYDMHKTGARRGCVAMRGEGAAGHRTALTEDLTRFREKCAAEDVAFADAIAFPFGAYDKDTVSIVKELGFRAAFTCTEKVNVLSGNPEELYCLGRFNRPHGPDSAAFFRKWES